LQRTNYYAFGADNSMHSSRRKEAANVTGH
jgi:hypothetical protein